MLSIQSPHKSISFDSHFPQLKVVPTSSSSSLVALGLETELVYYLQLDEEAFENPDEDIHLYFNQIVDKLAWLLLDPQCLVDRKSHLGLRSRLKTRSKGCGSRSSTSRKNERVEGEDCLEVKGKKDGRTSAEMDTPAGGVESFCIEVGPRLNFSSPFSTNAVGICHAAGIKKVKRLERAIRYVFTAEHEHRVHSPPSSSPSTGEFSLSIRHQRSALFSFCRGYFEVTLS